MIVLHGVEAGEKRGGEKEGDDVTCEGRLI